MATTPFAAHKLVNKALEEAGLTDRIPPQMMYNYTSGRVNKGKEPFIKYDHDKNDVDLESLKEWTDKYVAKKKAALVEA